MKPHRFIALDGWRGIAAAMVALHHFHTSGWLSQAGLVRNAYLFVDFFFLLSGFVIAANYRDRLASGFSPTAFMALRAGRLYPLHLVVLLAFVATEVALALSASGASSRQPFTGQTSPFAFITNLFLVQALGFHTGLTWNGGAWSISAEFWTYLAFAAAVIAAGRARPVGARVEWAFAAIAGLAVAFFAARAGWGGALVRFTDIARCLYGFSVGVLAFSAYERLAALPSVRDLLARRAGLAEAAAIALATAFLLTTGGETALFLAPVAFAPAILVFAFDAGPVSRQLARPAFVWAGVLSYSVYMVHAFVQARMLLPAGLLVQKVTGLPLVAERMIDGQAARVWGANPLAGDLASLVMLAAVFATSYLTWRFIEEPGRLASKRLVTAGSTTRPKTAGAGRLRLPAEREAGLAGG